ncbi:MAG: TonB-dependent receptor, partial [Janthinobacterium lividum]|nr:TonB-dependent receptor [Janthinobacterium lividum]
MPHNAAVHFVAFSHIYSANFFSQLMMPRRCLRLTVICSAVFFAWHAQAQQSETPAGAEAAAAPLKAEKVEKAAAPTMQTVEVKGSGYDPRRDDTASKMVVSSEEILKYGDSNVTDVLKRLPGITVSGAAGRS